MGSKKRLEEVKWGRKGKGRDDAVILFVGDDG